MKRLKKLAICLPTNAKLSIKDTSKVKGGNGDRDKRPPAIGG